MTKRTAHLVLLLAALTACQGSILSNTNANGSADKELQDQDISYSRLSLRRLTRTEIKNTLIDLTGIDIGQDIDLLPSEAFDPFDNDAESQRASSALVEGIRILAQRLSIQILDNPDSKQKVVGCEPAATDDETCFRQFIADFGSLVLRRSVSDAEIQEYLVLLDYARSSNDFYVAVNLALEALFQQMEFVYRVEIGEPVSSKPGTFRLNGFEIATRLSYLIWGSAPDSELLETAAAGKLDTADQIRAQAERMLGDEKSKRNLQNFHAMWLGYADTVMMPELEQSMLEESNALINRVVFDEQRPWTDLVTLQETWIDAPLAEHYGLAYDSSDSRAWISTAGSKRAGILGQGTFLSVGGRGEDTSIVHRGIEIRERLLCSEVPPPPPNFDVDNVPPPAENECKKDHLMAHATGGCAGCHSQIDPIGYGLEQFGGFGQYREAEASKPQCAIDGQGELMSYGNFNGPAELGQLLAETPDFASCAVEQFSRFALGRALDDQDKSTHVQLVDAMGAQGGRLDQLILELVSQTAFRFRTTEF
ncbi:MAG: DUF1592 domain-containing protein [Myxococcales bacterium]|nr:MAG: DUF1592 domain-containing protein [Myxococcales bacterium]